MPSVSKGLWLTRSFDAHDGAERPSQGGRQGSKCTPAVRKASSQVRNARGAGRRAPGLPSAMAVAMPLSSPPVVLMSPAPSPHPEINPG